MVWSGDVDLNDGELQKAYQHYRAQLELISGIGLKGRQAKDSVLEDLQTLYDWLVSDRDYAIKGVLLLVIKYVCLVPILLVKMENLSHFIVVTVPEYKINIWIESVTLVANL